MVATTQNNIEQECHWNTKQMMLKIGVGLLKVTGTIVSSLGYSVGYYR